MAYYTKVLQPDERVLVVGRLHWSIYTHAVLILALAGAVAIGAFWSSLKCDCLATSAGTSSGTRLTSAWAPTARAPSAAAWAMVSMCP